MGTLKVSSSAYTPPSLRRTGDQVQGPKSCRPSRRLTEEEEFCLEFATREPWQGEDQPPSKDDQVQGGKDEEEVVGWVGNLTGRLAAMKDSADLEEKGGER